MTESQNYIFNYTRKFNVTVNHVNADTNAVLSSESKTVYEGDSFSTPWKNMTDQNYFLCRNDDPTVTVDKTANDPLITSIKIKQSHSNIKRFH